MTSLRVIAHGRVQGVGYRWHVREAATLHHVTGWVRNRRDGTVEAALHGSAADVAAVLDAMRVGPTQARVEELRTRKSTEPAPHTFDILMTA